MGQHGIFLIIKYAPGRRYALVQITSTPCVLHIMSRDGKDQRSLTLMSTIAQGLPWDVL